MKTSTLPLFIALGLGACLETDDVRESAGKEPFDPASIAPVDPKSDEFTDATRIVAHLDYGHTARGEFSEVGYDGYTFDAEAGDVVSAFASGEPRDGSIDPVVLLYRLDGALGSMQAQQAPRPMEPLAMADDIDGSRNKNAHVVDFEIAEAGRYLLVVAEYGGGPGAYRLRLACSGGPCSPRWWSRDEDQCWLSEHGQQVWDAVQSGDPDKNPIPLPLTVSTRNAVGPVLRSYAASLYDDPADMPYPMIFPALADMIANAQYEVDIRSHRVGDADPLEEILDGLARLENRLRLQGRHGDPVKVRWIVMAFKIGALFGGQEDESVARMLHEKIRSLALDPELVRVEIATYSKLSAHEDHSKITVVDGTYVHTGGANPGASNAYDEPEHEASYLLKGEIGQAALADFDYSWIQGPTKLWTCDFDEDGEIDDCHTSNPKEPPPHRFEVTSPDWERFGLEWDACLPMIYLGSAGNGNLLSNAVDHPIAQGHLAALRSARTIARMESPNVNDDAVLDEIVDAAFRDPSVRLQLVVPPERNDAKVNLPGGGGTNEENHARLRGMLTRRLLEMCGGLGSPRCAAAKEKEADIVGKFQWRWHPIVGNSEGAQHVKYLSVDHQLAIIGSTNLDTQSFNRARESSVVVDDPTTVERWDEAVFLADFTMSEADDVLDDGRLE